MVAGVGRVAQVGARAFVGWQRVGDNQAGGYGAFTGVGAHAAGGRGKARAMP